MEYIGHFQQALLVEASYYIFEARRLAPGDAVPLLGGAAVVVVDGLEVVVLVVPARGDGVVKPPRLPRETRGLSDGRVDAVAATRAHDDAIDATASRSRSFPRRVADHGKVANNIPM